MDVRAWLMGLAFTAALIAGLGLGWWHGPAVSSVATGEHAYAEVAPPLESAGSGDAAPEPSPVPTRSNPVPYEGEVIAVGDSVLAGAAACLARRGISADAKQSRRLTDAVPILESLVDRLPPRVIVHLGTNGGAARSDIDAVMQVLGPDRIVMWSTIQLPDDPTRYTYERKTNDEIAAIPARYANARVFDWQSLSIQHPDWLYAEGIHMTPEGCKGYASLVEPQIRAP